MAEIFNQPWKLVPNKIRGAGGREIDKLRGVNPPVDTPDGSEAWIGSVTRAAEAPAEDPHHGCSEVVLPDGRRMFLFEAITINPEAILGKKHISRHGTNLGMLIKYLDAQEQYILQAHPTREFAKKMWNSDFGKEESWYMIGGREDTKEPPYILLGFKKGITREKWEELYHKGDLKGLEQLCHKIPVKAGETYFVGGGTPHALGEGCFCIEVQEPSDITVIPIHQQELKQIFASKLPDGADLSSSLVAPFLVDSKAVYDEKTLGSFVYEGYSYEENLRRWRIPPKIIREGPWGKEYFLIGPEQTDYFSFTQADVQGKVGVRITGFPQVGIVLAGEGAILFDGGKMSVKKGDEVFLPYNIPGAAIDGNLSLVFCHPEGVSEK
jgi:mannose-6-phosphate isomerase